MKSEKSKILAVIDTNIWVSALLNPYGYPAKLRNAFKDGLFDTVISEQMITELAEVLNRPRLKNKYNLSAADIEELLIVIEERSNNVLLSNTISICRDKNDDMIIETAIKGKAEYLVTRDDDMKFDRDVISRLFTFDVSVISIAKFLSILRV